MDERFELVWNEAIAEASNPNLDDFFTIGHLYFTCGWGNTAFFNESYAVAVALIGHCYTMKVKGKSDYSRGVRFIANNLGISRTQVKALRKKMEVSEGYAFKTPITTAHIIEYMITLLQNASNFWVVNEYLSIHRNKMFRTVLLHDQNEAIQTAANRSDDQRVMRVASELNHITASVGDYNE